MVEVNTLDCVGEGVVVSVVGVGEVDVVFVSGVGVGEFDVGIKAYVSLEL